MQNEIVEEKPLDPATEKLRRKMMRLLGVSIGIMFVGLMAVLGAIVYKISGPDEQTQALGLPGGGISVPIDPGFAGKVDLADGESLVSAALSGQDILLRVRKGDGGEYLAIYRIGDNRIVARIDIE